MACSRAQWLIEPPTSRSCIVEREGSGQTAPHCRLALGRAVARPPIVLELHQQRLILLAADHGPAPVAAGGGDRNVAADGLTHSRHAVHGRHEGHAGTTGAHGKVVLGTTAGHGGRRLRGVRVVEVVQSHRGERVVVPMMMQVEFHKFGK